VEFTTIHTNVKIILEVDSNYFKIVKKSDEFHFLFINLTNIPSTLSCPFTDEINITSAATIFGRWALL
jgi:hypothetical protein